MKIVTLNELRRMPDGIIAQEYEPETLGSMFMKICTRNFSDGPGWTGEIPIEPFFHEEEMGSDKKTRWTNWCSTDTRYFDHIDTSKSDDEVVFAVYDKNELLVMASILIDGANALAPDEYKVDDIFTNETMDQWFCEDKILSNDEVNKLLEEKECNTN